MKYLTNNKLLDILNARTKYAFILKFNLEFKSWQIYLDRLIRDDSVYIDVDESPNNPDEKSIYMFVNSVGAGVITTDVFNSVDDVIKAIENINLLFNYFIPGKPQYKKSYLKFIKNKKYMSEGK